MIYRHEKKTKSSADKKFQFSYSTIPVNNIQKLELSGENDKKGKAAAMKNTGQN